MAYQTYREIIDALRNMIPFRGNSASAEWIGDKFAPDSAYVVYSYGTEIARYTTSCDLSYVSDTFYSVTTCKIQSLCRVYLPRVMSNAEEAIDHIGPGSKVKWYGGFELQGMVGVVAEVYPIPKRFRVQFEWTDPDTGEFIPDLNIVCETKDVELR